MDLLVALSLAIAQTREDVEKLILDLPADQRALEFSALARRSTGRCVRLLLPRRGRLR